MEKKTENSKQRKAREKAEKAAKAGGTTTEVKAPKEPKVAKPRPEGALPPLPALPRSARERKPKPTKPCQCGCKTPTTGDWAPGHDARANGWALRIEREVIKLSDVPENEREGAKFMLKLRKEQGVKSGHVRLVKKVNPEAEQEPAADEATNQ